MKSLTQLQQEARKGFARIRSMSADDITPIDGRFLDTLTARVYAAALDAVESGMPKGLGLVHVSIFKTHRDKADGYERCREELLSHLRTLREGITGNEKSV